MHMGLAMRFKIQTDDTLMVIVGFNSTHLKFKYSIDTDQEGQIIAYNDLTFFIEHDSDNLFYDDSNTSLPMKDHSPKFSNLERFQL